MIGQLRGTLAVRLTGSHVIVDCGGVGYEVACSGYTLAALPEVDAPVTLRSARCLRPSRCPRPARPTPGVPMTALVPSRRHAVVDDDEIRTYAGIYVMKMMDLKPADGGMVFELPLPHELSPLDEVLVELESRGLVEMHRRKDRWDLTKAGLAHLATLIDEATDLMDEFDDDELPEVVAELRARNLDPLRARFLWGWYDGEFDDLVEFQRQRGVAPVQPLWAHYLMSEDFYAELARDLES